MRYVYATELCQIVQFCFRHPASENDLIYERWTKLFCCIYTIMNDKPVFIFISPMFRFNPYKSHNVLGIIVVEHSLEEIDLRHLRRIDDG